MSGTSRVLLGTVGALVIVAIAVIATMMMLHKDSGSKDDQSGSQTQPQTQPEKQTQPQVQTPPGGSTGPHTGAPAGTTPPGASTAEKPLGKNDQVASNIPRTPPGNLSGKTGGATAGSAGIAKQAIAMYNNKQFAQAQPLLQDACDRGNADCCEHLGFMYESSSLGVARDYTHAVTLLDKACKGGSML
jgi:cell division septation protein DedD